MATKKSPAPAPSGTRITAADVEAAERDRITAAALRLQQASGGPPPLTPEQEHIARLFDQLDRRPTAEELANQQAQARLQDIARRNAEGAEANRAYADRMRASGYRGWTEGHR
jgi:hypothetical protein